MPAFPSESTGLLLKRGKQRASQWFSPYLEEALGHKMPAFPSESTGLLLKLIDLS